MVGLDGERRLIAGERCFELSEALQRCGEIVANVRRMALECERLLVLADRFSVAAECLKGDPETVVDLGAARGGDGQRLDVMRDCLRMALELAQRMAEIVVRLKEIRQDRQRSLIVLDRRL